MRDTTQEPPAAKKAKPEPTRAKKAKLEPQKAKKAKPEPAVVDQLQGSDSGEDSGLSKRVKKEEPKLPKTKKAELEPPKSKKAELEPPKIKKADPEPSEIEEVEAEPALASQLGFGSDSCGELGLGKIGIARKNPTQVPIDECIKQVACGPMHTLTLTESGKVYSYGCNDEGALGRETDGDESLEATPTVVDLKHPVTKITAGDSHSLALTDQNEVFIWGNFRDEHGSVGLTPSCDGNSSCKPIQLLPETKFKDIASGSNHILLLDADGVVYSSGVGAQGQLGRLEPEEIGAEGDSKALTAENRSLFLTPQKVDLKDVDPQRPFVCDAIYAGNFSSFATNTDKKKNRLAGWGLNNYHQLGYKGRKGQLVQHFPRRSTFTCSTTMVNVACGQHHTLFLTKTGRVYAAGRHEYGMLGLGKVDKEVCPAKPVDTLKNSNVVDISAGINTSFAVDSEGKLFAWGMGGINLGLQSDDDLIIPTEVKSLEGKRVLSVSAGGSFTSVVVK